MNRKKMKDKSKWKKIIVEMKQVWQLLKISRKSGYGMTPPVEW